MFHSNFKLLTLVTKSNFSQNDDMSLHLCSQQTNIQDQMSSQVNSTKQLEKELTPILLKLFQKIEEEEMLLNVFHSTKPVSS